MNDAPPATHDAQKRPKYSNWKFIFWALPLAVIIIFPGSFLWVPAVTIYRADEGFKHARKTINPEELRQWALQEITKRSGTNGDSTIPASEIPDYILKLYSKRPEDAMVGGSDGQHIVFIIWGGGFFHWGINIGDTNFSEPHANEDSEYRDFEWTRGIYYSREANWPLW